MTLVKHDARSLAAHAAQYACARCGTQTGVSTTLNPSGPGLIRLCPGCTPSPSLVELLVSLPDLADAVYHGDADNRDVLKALRRLHPDPAVPPPWELWDEVVEAAQYRRDVEDGYVTPAEMGMGSVEELDADVAVSIASAVAALMGGAS